MVCPRFANRGANQGTIACTLKDILLTKMVPRCSISWPIKVEFKWTEPVMDPSNLDPNLALKLWHDPSWWLPVMPPYFGQR